MADSYVPCGAMAHTPSLRFTTPTINRAAQPLTLVLDYIKGYSTSTSSRHKQCRNFFTFKPETYLFWGGGACPHRKPVSLGHEPVSLGHEPVSLGHEPVSLGHEPASLGHHDEPVSLGRHDSEPVSLPVSLRHEPDRVGHHLLPVKRCKLS